LEVDFLIRPHQGWAPQRNARHVRKMGAQTQHKARPQVGRPNATQGTPASLAPQRTSAMQTQGTSARPQVGRPNATQGTSARWAPKRNTRHVRKLGAPTQRKARPQVGRPNARPQRKRKTRNARHARTSASWAPQRNARHVRKMGAQTQNFILNESVHTREH
jgi:hypothetical protein